MKRRSRKFKFIGNCYKPNESWLDLAIDFQKNFGNFYAFLSENKSFFAKIKIKILEKEADDDS